MSYTITCSCGAKARLDAREFGRMRVCPSCKRGFSVRWGKDRKTRKPVPVLVAQARMRAGVRDDETPFLAVCKCGYRRPLPEREAATTPKCPGCGKTMTVERIGGAPSRIDAKAKTRFGTSLLPLHLRPPLKIEIHSGAKVVTCPCGERILVRPTSLGKPTQCPNCDRWLQVEVVETTIRMPAQPRSTATRLRTPAPMPAVKPGTARSPSRQPGPGECVCPCGGIIPPRTSRTGREFTCASCGRKGRVEEAPDARPGAPSLRAVITQEATSPPAAAPEPPPGPTSVPPGDAQSAICGCGAELLVSAADVDTQMQCPGCATLMVVEKALDPLGGPPGLRIRKVEEEAPPAEIDESWNLEDFK